MCLQLRAHLGSAFVDPHPAIHYHDRSTETVTTFSDNAGFLAVLTHAAQSFSIFSMLISTDMLLAKKKPKFMCIRSWLINSQPTNQNEHRKRADSHVTSAPVLEMRGSTGKQTVHFTFSQCICCVCDCNVDGCAVRLVHLGVSVLTNAPQGLFISNQSVDSFEILGSPKASRVASAYPPASQTDNKMLHDKMMMDPAISMVLFNDYIPLRRPEQTNESSQDVTGLTRQVGGLFLGKCPAEERKSDGLFIRSEMATTAQNGMFLRSGTTVSTASPAGKTAASPKCSTSDEWVIA